MLGLFWTDFPRYFASVALIPKANTATFASACVMVCRTCLNFLRAPIPGAPHTTIFERTPLRQSCSDRHETMRSGGVEKGYVWLLAFVCTTFRPYPSFILEKELTEIFALCPGRDIQLARAEQFIPTDLV
jgi:hypothetical protein